MLRLLSVALMNFKGLILWIPSPHIRHSINILELDLETLNLNGAYYL